LARTVNFFDGASSGTVPTIGNVVASDLVTYANDAAFEAANVGAPTEGNIYFNTTLNLIRYYTGSAWVSIADESSAQTFTNKTIDADNNTISNVGDEELKAGIDAAKIADGSVSNAEYQYIGGLTSDAQAQLNAKIPNAEKGAANGVAELDSNTRLPEAQLTLDAMQYKGDWDANTNTPTLADSDTDKDGDLYRVSVAGTQNLGGAGGGGSSEVSSLTDTNDVTYGTGTSVFSAQSFTTTGSFDVGSIKIKYAKETTATGNISMQIWGISAGIPNSSDVIGVSDSISVTALGTDPSLNIQTFTFPTQPTLSATTKYAIVFDNSGLGGSQQTLTRRDVGTVYPGGGIFISTDATSWGTEHASQDWYFDVLSAVGLPANNITVDVGDFVYNDGTQYQQSNSISGKEDVANKGVAGGYCPLDGGALVPAANLPSYVDDVLEFADLGSFPGTGETGKIYIAIDTNFVYRWTGSVYVDITSKVDSVNGQVGAVVLDADDISDTSTTNKFAIEAQLVKINHITVTQPVDLDTMETDVNTNNAKVSADGSIGTHSDVDVTTTAPITGDILEFDGSDWVPVENVGGSGQGGINYLEGDDASVDSSVGNWDIYDDGAVSDPVDGAGGSPTSALLHTTSAASVLRGSGSLQFSLPNADVQGEGISVDFTIDNQDKEKSLLVSFDYKNTKTSALRVFVYDVTNATLLGAVSNDDDGYLKNLTGTNATFVGKFYTTDASDYRLIVHMTTTEVVNAAGTYDNFKVGPEEFAPGYIGTEPVDFTPSFTNFTLGNGTVNKAKWWRAGSFMKGCVRVTLGSTSSMGTGPLMDIPDSELIDDAVFVVDTNRPIGSGIIQDISTQQYITWIECNTSTTMVIRYLTSSAQHNTITATAPFTWTTGDVVDFDFEVPIDGWKASNLISTQESLFSNALIDGAGNGGTVLTASVTNIDFIEVEDKFGLWDGAIFTAPKTAYYSFLGSTLFTGASGAIIYAYVNGTITRSTTTNASLNLKKMVGTLLLQKGDALSFRASTGVTLANDVTNHFLNIWEFKDLSVFGVNGVTEIISSGTSVNENYVITVGNMGDLTSILLPSGEWDITAQAQTYAQGAITTSRFNIGISEYSGNDLTGLDIGSNRVYAKPATVSGDFTNLAIAAPHNVTVTEPTTYYLKAQAETSITNLQVSYKISARRIK